MSNQLIRRGSAQKRGTALVVAMVLVTVVAVMATTFTRLSLDASRQTNLQGDVYRLNKGAESAIGLAAHRVWRGYLAQQGGGTGNLVSFRMYLDGLGVPNHGAGATPQTAAGSDITALLDLPEGGAAPWGIANVNVDAVRVVRADDAQTTTVFFAVTVTGRRGDGATRTPLRRSVEQAYVTEGADWSGLEYALLGNNVNCIMCHARIDSAPRFHNEDPGQYGLSDRVKVGTLESLLLRSGADSHVAGTLYIRGVATDKAGNPIADWTAQTLTSYAFDGDGRIVEDAWGDPTVTDLVPADATDPQPLENLYLDYSSDETAMVDGYLPTTFPAPFPDDGGIDPDTGLPVPEAADNKTVDPSEYYALAYTASGTVSGGTVYVADVGGPAVDTPAALATLLGGGNQATLASDTTGNVVLTGTVDNPITLDGTIAIDGDLIIQGYVRGDGALLVSGNVYLPTDVVYADGTTDGTAEGPRTFGIAQDGTSNSMALAAGGSIIVGDLFYLKDPSKQPPITGYEDGGFGFTMSELALFNRGEWSKTQPILPGLGEDPSDPAAWTQVNSGYEGAEYVPRYYGFTDGGTIPFYSASYNSKKPSNSVYFDGDSGTWKGKEHPGDWTKSMSLAYPADPTDPYLYNPDGTPKAAIHTMTGGDGWITNDMLALMMATASADHAVDQPLKVDGLLYTNNSIMGLVGSSTPMNGQMIANGGIVAADVGLLVPGNKTMVENIGLYLNFDRRPAELLDLKSDEEISFTRVHHVSYPIQE